MLPGLSYHLVHHVTYAFICFTLSCNTSRCIYAHSALMGSQSRLCNHFHLLISCFSSQGIKGSGMPLSYSVSLGGQLPPGLTKAILYVRFDDDKGYYGYPPIVTFTSSSPLFTAGPLDNGSTIAAFIVDPANIRANWNVTVSIADNFIAEGKIMFHYLVVQWSKHNALRALLWERLACSSDCIYDEVLLVEQAWLPLQT